MTVTPFKPGDIVSWGAPGTYETRGIVRAVSRDQATLFVHQTSPVNERKQRFVRVQSHQARKVRKSTL